ncbi:MAG: hypothetical protein U1C49_01385 [Candidatus Andersenbacteria bacterium]|nr:hypothetical protein [bacterium]MDZ4225479.1 hypothetical protein [Candidatus Andersenbacteria bacterium]
MADNNDLKDLTDLDEARLYAAMCYLFVLVFIPILTRRDNPLINWHARQGLVISVGFVLASAAAAWNGVLGGLVFLLLLIADIVAMVQALQGRKWKAPFMGMLAEKIRI